MGDSVLLGRQLTGTLTCAAPERYCYLLTPTDFRGRALDRRGALNTLSRPPRRTPGTLITLTRSLHCKLRGTHAIPFRHSNHSTRVPPRRNRSPRKNTTHTPDRKGRCATGRVETSSNPKRRYTLDAGHCAKLPFLGVHSASLTSSEGTAAPNFNIASDMYMGNGNAIFPHWTRGTHECRHPAMGASRAGPNDPQIYCACLRTRTKAPGRSGGYRQ